MNDQLVSFEVAKLAQEKGFNGSYIYVYDKNTHEIFNELDVFIDDLDRNSLIPIPTQSLLQKWLRDIHKLDFWMAPCGINGDKYQVEDITSGNKILWSSMKSFDTYEEAIEDALLNALDLL